MTDDTAALATLLRTKYASDNPHAEDIARALERLSTDLTAAQERIARLTAMRWDAQALHVGPAAFGYYWDEGGNWYASRFHHEWCEPFPTEAEARAALEAAAMDACK